MISPNVWRIPLFPKQLVCKGNDNGKVMTQPSISNYIMQHSYGGLGEGRVAKAVLSFYAQKGDINSIRRISKSRGTNLETLIDYYMPHLSVEKK